MTDNIIDRDKLQDALIESIIDGMDHKTMHALTHAFVYDNLNDHLDKYSVNELIQETEEYYPELLQDAAVVHVNYTDTPMAEEVYGG